jgi:hypothetical protein
MVYLMELLSVMLPPCFQFMAFVLSSGREQPLLGREDVLVFLGSEVWI